MFGRWREGLDALQSICFYIPHIICRISVTNSHKNMGKKLEFYTMKCTSSLCCFVQKISVFAPLRSANSGTVR